MHFTLSTSVIGALALASQTFASPLASGASGHPGHHRQPTGYVGTGHRGSYHPHPTGSYRFPNGTYGNSTNTTSDVPTVTVWQTMSPPPVYSVTPVPMASYTPGPKLSPAVHWNQPVDDIQNLNPTNASSLYYSQGAADPAVEHLFASLNSSSQYQSVVLDHSSFVKSVSCAADGVLVTFTGPEGFNYAANAWPQGGTDFVLVTNTDGCGNATNDRTYWLIDSLSYVNETNAIDAKVTRELGVEEALGDVHMVWGKNVPTNSTLSKRLSLGGLISGDESITKTADINLAAPTGDASPWGGAKLLFEKAGTVSVSNKTNDIDTDFKIFCVNCGVKSHFQLMGEVKWSYIHAKITSLTAEVDASVVANFHLGLVATAEFNQQETKNIFNQAIPDLGFSVGDGLFDAGVYVTVDAVADIDITATGQALAGVTMTIPNFKATLDMTDENAGSNSKVTGLTPTWDKQFEIAGSLGAKCTLALPVGLHLGIKVSKFFDKSIALVEQPSLSAEATIAGSIGAPVSGTTCNNGVSYSIDAHNDVSLNLFDIKTFQIEHADFNILSGCKQLPQSSTSVAKSTVVSSTIKPTSTKPASTKPAGITTSKGSLSTGLPKGGANSTMGHASGTGKYPISSTGTATHPKGTGAPGSGPYGGLSSTVPTHGTGASTHPAATYGHGTGASTRPAATSTGIPTYGGSGNSSHTAPHGSGVSSKPEATATTTKLPGYGGESSSSAVSTKAEATSKSASIPAYGGETTGVSTKASATTTSVSTPKAPGYGGESSSSTSVSTKPAATTTSVSTPKAPGYGGAETSTFVTSTKPAYATTTSSSSSSTITSTTTTSSSSSSSTMHTTSTEEAESTTAKAKATPIGYGVGKIGGGKQLD